ncbi:MAG: alpha/beta fold hydrolase [Acidobacteriota bacterium]
MNSKQRLHRLILPCGLSMLLVLSSATLATEEGTPAPGAPAPASDLTSERKIVTIEGGTTVEVEAGTLQVPENRKRPGKAKITIPYYRLRTEAEKPAPTVFLLAGGPGSSWIERFENEENFAEVTFYQQFADVVLFDQRGGGLSTPSMDCEERDRLAPDEPLDLNELGESMRRLAAQCRDRWRAEGIDLSAYNTDENAADVDALRRALGYERISLVGGSYGSHLALHMLRRYPDVVERAMLYGIEGPDHTWDGPGAMLATLERIAAVAEASEELGPRIPEEGLIATLKGVQERLAEEPVPVTLRRGEQEMTVVVDSTAVQFIARHRAGRRSDPNFWPELILAMAEGDFSLAARGAMALRGVRLQDPMHYMMDCASGISTERRQNYLADPASGVLGNLNFEYTTLCEVWDAPDLGPVFRADVPSDIPVLIFHGTWDTSTPIDNAREVTAALTNGHLVEVVGGTHGALYNLYADWPPMHDLVRAFLTGEAIDPPASVELPAVTFRAPTEPETVPAR